MLTCVNYLIVSGCTAVIITLTAANLSTKPLSSLSVEIVPQPEGGRPGVNMTKYCIWPRVLEMAKITSHVLTCLQQV